MDEKDYKIATVCIVTWMLICLGLAIWALHCDERISELQQSNEILSNAVSEKDSIISELCYRLEQAEIASGNIDND